MTRNVTALAAVVLETYGDFRFSTFPSCVALSDTRFIVTANYKDAPAPFDGTISVWLLDNHATILDATKITATANAFLPCGPMRINSTTAIMAADDDGNTTRTIIGLDLTGDTITTTHQTESALAGAAYPGDGWISADGTFCIARFVTGSDAAIPTTHDVYDPATGAHLGAAPYAPNVTGLLIDQLSPGLDIPPDPDYGDIRTAYTMDVPGYGPASAGGDTSTGLFTESVYQHIGGGVGSHSSGTAGSEAQGYVGVNYPGGRGILAVLEFYAIKGLVAAIVPGTIRPPLRQRQRSDGLAASGAPRHHQHSTLQTSNRQRAVR